MATKGTSHAATAPAAKTSNPENDMLPVLRDAAIAIKLIAWSHRKRILRCFVYVPIGAFAILSVCYGVHELLSMGGVHFPASVACLLLLFFALLICDKAIGERRTKKLVHVINVSGGWSLRWLNIFFTPAFVMLPLSPAISAVEVGKIIAVFVFGFLAMMVFAAYMTRALQLLQNKPRKGQDVQGTTSLGTQHPDTTELELLQPPPEAQNSINVNEHNNDSFRSLSEGLRHHAHQHRLPPAPPRSHAAAYITIRGQNLDDPLSSFSDVSMPYPRIVVPVRPPRPRAECWAEHLGNHADAVFFASMLILVGLPAYYAAPAYPMPLHLTINILMFFGAMGLPASWRQVLHPVIVSAFSTLLVIWLLGRIRGDSLQTVLDTYRSGTTYIELWASASKSAAFRAALVRPGAGDILASVMDVSIVSLALPMYQYKRELRRHFLAIVVPNVVLSITSLFVYPVVCFRIGISPERSLAFTSRSLTLALATPTVKNLGGDLNTVAAVAIISGVLGVLIGRQMLSWMRIPEDDYVTRGVTLGANASALGTALLLRTDPRAAALSSLAMSLFGTVTVAFSSIPPMVHIIRSLVGLS